MDMAVEYDIARFVGQDDDARLFERTQLVRVGGQLRVRDMAGIETVCTGLDIVSTIASTPALREIRAGQVARIACGSEIEAQLPFLLVPVFADDAYAECLADVNGGSWVVYPTVDGDHVVIPGGDPLDEPDMNPCWAEFEVVEGESNPLSGYTSIGLLRPGVTVEYARYDHGGMGSDAAVAVSRFDDLAPLFVEWLQNSGLAQLWQGDSAPPWNAADLFPGAVAAADHRARWNTDMDFEIDADQNEESNDSMPSWACLTLDLPDSDLASVRDRLSA